MDNTVYVAGSRMGALVTELDRIAANLSNADTPGFKQTVGEFQSVLQQFMPWQPVPGEGAVPRPHWPQLGNRQIDWSQGAIRITGRPLDVAIRGEAFLSVDTEDGERFTRKGRIHLSHDGELIDDQGHVFVADRGALRVPDGTERISIAMNGEVRADGESVGRLKLSDVPDRAALVPVGHGLYRNDGSAARDSSDSDVLGGAIEDSNTDPVGSLVAMIQANRAYEAAAKILRRMDEAGSQLIKSAT